jgi:hypothetical protein
VTFTQQLKESEELACELSVVEVLYTSITLGHAKAFCFVCPLKGIKIQDTAGGKQKELVELIRPNELVTAPHYQGVYLIMNSMGSLKSHTGM